MENTLPSREAVLAFVQTYVKDPYQLHHAQMVELAMRAVAKHLGENEELFGITGLVHDWDFDQWPDQHPGQYEKLQAELGVPNSVIDAIKGHADIDYPRTTKLAQALMACDEFSGLLYAYSKMTGSYGAMKTSSIQKKLYKELNFAAKINRHDILTGIKELEIPEETFIELIRNAFAAAYDNQAS
jgi:predicted hydrolase (HD superfamily)